MATYYNGTPVPTVSIPKWTFVVGGGSGSGSGRPVEGKMFPRGSK